MSSAARCSGAHWMVVLSSVLAACSGTSTNDLFAPSTGTGRCVAASCAGADATPQGASAAATSTGSAGAGASGAQTTGGGASMTGAAGVTSGAGGVGSGAGGVTGGGGTAPGAGGAGAGGAGTGGTAGGTGVAGASGTAGGAGGTPFDLDASVDAPIHPPPTDGGPPDQRADAIVAHDACVPTGTEVCDGLDNNCNNDVDERACPDGCIGAAFRGVGYMLCYSLNQQRSFNASRTVCEGRGMRLVQIDNAEQDAWIYRVAATAAMTNPINHVWIGASDQENEGVWQWTDGTTFWMGAVNGRPVQNLYNHWDEQQPNDSPGSEDCGSIYMPSNGAWIDVDCSGQHSFVCQSAPR